jgi:N-acetylmuramoyl-L-alanine amidase
MLPQHGTNGPQPGDSSPYAIEIASSGDQIVVTLTDVDGSSPFIGFLIQARQIQTNTIVGKFTSLPKSGAKFLTCLIEDSSVTHSDTWSKHSVRFTWSSLGSSLDGVHFVATVVQSFDTFWTNIYSSDLGDGDQNACLSMDLVTREEWDARDPVMVEYLNPPVNMTFVHHTAGSQCFDKQTCIAIMQAIQNFHMDDRGWNDIGYSFLIGEDGRVYEGRGWNVVGAHTQYYNSVAFGFSVMGNFMLILPNEAALTALQTVISCGVQQGYIRGDYEMFGHRDAKCTDCPGDLLYAEIETWAHFSDRDIPYYC